MKNIDFAPKLSPRFIVYLRDFLLDLGIEPLPILQKSGISEIAESDLALPVSSTHVLSLFDGVSKEIDDPLLGFNLARRFHFESSSVIVLAMLAAPNVKDSLVTLSRFDKYVDTGITTSYDFSGKASSFSVGLVGVDGNLARHINEYLITFTVHALNVAVRKGMPIKKVCFQHVQNEGVARLREFFNSEIQFGCDENKIVFDSSYLDEHLHTNNELLYEILENALKNYFSVSSKKQGFIDSVCRELIRQSELQSADLQSVADALMMSTRTLRRRIQAEGLTFQQVKNMARERLTKYYLTNTNKSLSEIAFELGYTELSSFSRAFRNWTGNTPQEYREHARKLISG